MGGPEQLDDDAPPGASVVAATAAGDVERTRDRRNRVLDAFLLSCRSEHTRRAYAGDITDFFD